MTRGRRIVLMVLGLAVLAGLAALWWRNAAGTHAAPTPQRQPDVAAPLPAPAPTRRAATAPAGDAIDACLAGVPLPAGWTPAAAASAVEARQEQRWDAFMALLARSQDPAMKAVAGIMAARGELVQRMQNGETGLGRSIEASALVQVATESGDALTRSLANAACVDAPVDGCAALATSTQPPAQGGEAAPWLQALARASRAGDDAGRANALYHLSLATTISDPGLQLGARMLDAVALEWPDQRQQFALLALAHGTTMWTGMGGMSELRKTCAAARGANDANQLQLCDKVADLFTQQSQSTREFIYAKMLRTTLGQTDQAKAIESEYQRLIKAEDSVMRWVEPDGSGMPDCRMNAVRNAWAEQKLQFGDLASLRHLAGASAK